MLHLRRASRSSNTVGNNKTWKLEARKGNWKIKSCDLFAQVRTGQKNVLASPTNALKNIKILKLIVKRNRWYNLKMFTWMIRSLPWNMKCWCHWYRFDDFFSWLQICRRRPPELCPLSTWLWLFQPFHLCNQSRIIDRIHKSLGCVFYTHTPGKGWNLRHCHLTLPLCTTTTCRSPRNVRVDQT